MDIGLARSSSSAAAPRRCGRAETARRDRSSQAARTRRPRRHRCRRRSRPRWWCACRGGQRVVHQPREQLHGHVLEGERRPVKQFQNKLMRPDLGAAPPPEGGTWHRPRSPCGRVGIPDLAAGERTDHLDRDLPIGPAEKPAIAARREVGPGLWHIEAAVTGKPSEHHVTKAEPGASPRVENIASQTALQRPAGP